jgi:hypothetical protein
MFLLPRTAAYKGRLPAFIRSWRSVAVGPRGVSSLFSSNRSSLKRLAKSQMFQTLANLAGTYFSALIAVMIFDLPDVLAIHFAAAVAVRDPVGCELTSVAPCFARSTLWVLNT